jgi:hypothetical protein
MKPRHAAALVLVGWYLMVPPTKETNQMAPSVPLPNWVVLRAFDTADACNEAQDQLRYHVSRLNLQNPVVSAASEAAEFSQCIASDDPRLRENEASPQHALRLVYIVFILAGLLWITYLSKRLPHSPPGPQTLRNPIHDAQPVPAPAPRRSLIATA